MKKKFITISFIFAAFLLTSRISLAQANNASLAISNDGTVSVQEIQVEKEIPWAWYASRANGIMAYFILWWVMFFGLSIRTPFLKNILAPIFSLETHRWLSVQSLFFAFLHAAFLLGDKYLKFQILDLIIPFHAHAYANDVALGILGLYLMIILIITSYFRKFISFKLWRVIHFLNIILFVLVTMHAFAIGSDLKEGFLLHNIFIWANSLLAFVLVVNLLSRLSEVIFTRKTA